MFEEDDVEIRIKRDSDAFQIEPIFGDCMPALQAVRALNPTPLTMELGHLDWRLQKIRELVARKLVRFCHVKGITNPADLFTKLVTKKLWDKFVSFLLNTNDDYGFMGDEIEIP